MAERPVSTHPLTSARAALFWTLSVYLVLVWFGGGPTLDVTSTDEWLMLFALAPFVLGSAILLFDVPASKMVRLAVLLALMVPAIPLVQLMPFPESIWHWSSYRLDVARDLEAASVASDRYTWSLWPEGTTRALISLFPPLSIFLSALALGDARARNLVQLALALVIANLAFGLFQVGLPSESGMRLYSDNGSGIGGVLVNSNHQGTALIVGMLVGMGSWARQRRSDKDLGQTQGLRTTAYATATLACLAAVALTSSSGAMVIALVAFASGVFATGLLSLGRLHRSRSTMAASAGVFAVLLLGVISAQSWMNLEQTEPLRYQLAREAAALGFEHAPLGSGAGTYADSFAQAASLFFQRAYYINHAHNEFAQWWFEAGWLGVFVLLSAIVLLLSCGWNLLNMPRRDPVAIACWLAVLAVLAHSWVDFPLRTLSLSSMTALLAGIAVGAASRGSRTTDSGIVAVTAPPQRA